MLRRVLASLVILAVFALGASGTLAAPKPTLSATPNPLTLGDSLNISGCGYPAEIELSARTTEGTGGIFWDIATQGGCFAISYPLSATGTWKVWTSKVGNANRTYVVVYVAVV